MMWLAAHQSPEGMLHRFQHPEWHVAATWLRTVMVRAKVRPVRTFRDCDHTHTGDGHWFAITRLANVTAPHGE